MKILNELESFHLKHEYGLDGKRLLPWEGLLIPFEGAYCIARKNTRTTPHINEPLGEEELFIAISGKGKVWIEEDSFEMKKGDVVFIPAMKEHYIENKWDEDFHFYAIWWSKKSASQYIASSENLY